MNITLLGAGGKMGGRLTANLRPRSEYSIDYVEISESGRKRLAEQQIQVTAVEDAIARANVVILAIPDAAIGAVTQELIPKLRPGTMVFGLDPAAAYAEVMPIRPDLTYFVAHPCHPPLFTDTEPANPESDWFGGRGTLPQSVVCALHRGPEEDYALGEKLAADMFAPILRLHRISVEQMAILEPAIVESTMLTCVTIMKQAMDEAVRHGIPEQAARDFCLGHIRTELAIVFGFAGFPVSDGAKRAVEQNLQRIFQDDWRDVISLPALRESVRDICKVHNGS
ncbi:MAG: semialdehyde dehydrogenase [Verrucomicrobia bacterium]|nr:semialdehyde dehydrogenase [Verrucomicrobiota bacterium]